MLTFSDNMNNVMIIDCGRENALYKWILFFFIIIITFCIEFAGHATGDEIAAEVPPGGNVGQCSKFADCNKYCQEN